MTDRGRAALAAIAMAGTGVLAADRTYHELTLKGAVAGNRDVVLVIGVENERVAEHAAMVADRPRTAQCMPDLDLILKAGRLTGSIAIQIPPGTERMDLDADLGTGGTYRVHYGCPVPPRGVEGRVSVEFPKSPTEKRHVIWLHEAMGEGTRLGLVLNLDRAAKTVQAIQGWASGYNRGSHILDIAGLSFDGARLDGEVGIIVVSDGIVPEHGKPVEGRIKVAAALTTNETAGTYAATIGIDRTRPGALAAAPATKARMKAMEGLVAKWVEYVIPWRACMVVGPTVTARDGALGVAGPRGGSTAFDPASGDAEAAGFSRLPPADWMAAGFDDRYWARYIKDDLTDFLGGFGVSSAGMQATGPALLCLRTSFGVADPGQVTDLKVAMTFMGGAVVYVNGREVGRSFMPGGAVNPITPADAYPLDAYTADGATPLPDLRPGDNPDPKWLARYGQRIREFSVGVPADALLKGRNVLAVEIHRAVRVDAVASRWVPLGLHGVSLESESGAGLVSFEKAFEGPRVWSANPEEQIAENPSLKPLFAGGGNSRRVRGIPCGNPFDPVLPIRMAAPRNGVCSAQAVVTDRAGLRGLDAKIDGLEGARGRIPASALEIRYAVQRAGWPHCDGLVPVPPDGAKTVPVWLIVQTPKDQASGWYTGTLRIRTNGKDFSVPVQLLVTGAVLPEPRDYSSLIGVANGPDSVAGHYKVKAWSDEHLRLMEPSLRMVGQLGNDVLRVPVILGGMQPPARDWMTAGSQGPRCSPLVRWVKNGDRLAPDFRLLEKYLDLYLKYCAPPQAISVYVWDAACSPAVADAYEARRIPTRMVTVKTPLVVMQWDPQTGAESDLPAPQFGEPGSKEFWMPLFDGLREIVRRRGWSERIIMASMGGDMRPSQGTGELLRDWVPYLRWNFLSHFSGDPGPKDGKLIATGGLEVGLKEHPWRSHHHAYTAGEWEADMTNRLDFLDLPTARWHWGDDSPPLMFRTLPLLWGTVGHLGLDFWPGVRGVPGNGSFFTHSSTLTVPGPNGAEPTVRFQMLREGVQDVELRRMLVRGYRALAEDRRRLYRELLDEVPKRMAWSWFTGFMSQHELAYNWPALAARVQMAAAELTGADPGGTWDEPPEGR